MIFKVKGNKIIFKDRSIKDLLINDGFTVMGKKEFSIMPIEALYLLNEKNAKIISDDKYLDFDNFIKIFKIDLKIFAVYHDLRKKGYSIDPNLRIMNKNLDVNVFSPNDKVNVEKLKDSIVAIVDDDLDVTYYAVKEEEIFGEFEDGNGYFLSGEGKFGDKLKENLYKDLVRRNCRVKSGLKFGTEFIVYVNSKDMHSKYMVKILRDGMEWIEVAGLARVANGVKKILIIAIPGKDFKYYSIAWQRI
ncbi:MAG: hypothetical protein QXG55_00910 [Thermoplasmata archaeon]